MQSGLRTAQRIERNKDFSYVSHLPYPEKELASGCCLKNTEFFRVHCPGRVHRAHPLDESLIGIRHSKCR